MTKPSPKVTTEDIEEGLDTLAQLLELGEDYVASIYERFERELAATKLNPTVLDRAKARLREREAAKEK